MTLEVSLKQEMIFRERYPRKLTNKLVVVNGPQIEQLSDVQHSLTLPVPLNLPIVHNTCSIISVAYIVSAKLDIPGSFDLICNLPIILTNQQLPPCQREVCVCGNNRCKQTKRQ